MSVLKVLRHHVINMKCLLFGCEWEEALDPWEEPMRCARCGKRDPDYVDSDWVVASSLMQDEDGYWDDDHDDWRMG